MFKQIGHIVKRNPVFLSVRYKAAYEGDGKTTVRVINQEQDLGLMIDAFATYGFRLNNGITVLGPIAIFPRTILSWQVKSSKEITEDSLRFFKLLEPKIDLLIIGLESNDRSTTDTVFRAARAVKLNVEILATEHACSTFNFLNSEARSVAGAIIPPLHVEVNEDDMLKSKLHYENLYKKELH
ncbi:NADH dehydrogenase [ubiquinone] 1 alpha subcomplex assembly factor 3 isoform X2 [Pararge aegeria]|uniref:NADH dehydrogenase [ubiquinone] 1 alpha subcomplex assembly factor 3 n=1 Tax=Pararge aegeria aegeria TaxID=348720 RepID=A0A8S4S9F4_9NEOP|nr:NADH dehydrogenase [ubiquinone] 1 alpha subcomplex assembly factor 3 isoform X2 [Pararge aegeria]CAH2252728.1 jg10180 [Pararge aegeria aegeria]